MTAIMPERSGLDALYDDLRHVLDRHGLTGADLSVQPIEDPDGPFVEGGVRISAMYFNVPLTAAELRARTDVIIDAAVNSAIEKTLTILAGDERPALRLLEEGAA